MIWTRERALCGGIAALAFILATLMTAVLGVIVADSAN
jgi:hypothetical protein